MTTGASSWIAAHEGVAIEVAVCRDEAAGERLEVRAVVDEAGLPGLERLFAALRHASAQGDLAARGLAEGFRVEDLIEIEAAAPGEDEAAIGERWLRRRVPRETVVRARAGAERREVHATFARRGALPTSQRARYQRDDGRMRVEAFELHVVEHCNLRCAHCCNMSPYLADKTLGVAEIASMCRTMAAHLQVDVFKIMGGEPLLHPDIAGALDAIRRSGISERVRLFTNGLLLHTMGDDFWRALDELTLSNYTSAPVKPALLEAAREKARAFGVVLNVKPVAAFSEVMRAEREDDEQAVRRTYAGCWLRHRCLVVRGGKFFMCTRAAYAEEFHRDLLHGAHPGDRALALEGDGVPVDTPDLGPALLAYMNRTEPLASCRFCHGGAGPLAPHAQLSKADVREGRLRPLRAPRAS
jgi:Radical SAM superfamily/4Fe-4S single cluster domain